MINLFRIVLVATAVVASSSTTMAQSRGETAANESFAQSWNEGAPGHVRIRSIVRDPAHNPRNDVYDGRRYVGSDPDRAIRIELLRDSEGRY
jgi:hypothetical protein